MSVLNGLLNRVKSVQQGLSSGVLVEDVLVGYKEDILELQRLQLLEGKASDGQDLRPYYSEDLKPSGWFKTKDTAKNYAVWKESLSYPHKVERNSDAPNLYITGKFHNELGVELRNDSVAIIATTPYAAKIMSKYGTKVFGLMYEKWKVIFIERKALEKLQEEIKKKLYE